MKTTATIPMQDIDNAKEIMESAMLKALISLGDKVHGLSNFCTLEEEFEQNKAKQTA